MIPGLARKTEKVYNLVKGGARLNWQNILAQVAAGRTVGPDELATLLSLREDNELELLFEAARQVRERALGRKVFFYGFLYFSTICRNRCSFCFYRANNPESPRYRKSLDEVLTLASELGESGIHTLDLTMAEDPFYQADGFRELIHLVREVKKATGVTLMISPGVVPRTVLANLRTAGADWFALYQETHNTQLYERLRPGQDYAQRWQTKVWARELGYLLEEGILIGVGETPRDRADSLLAMADLGAVQVRAMSFVPQPATPLAEYVRPDPREELAFLAVARLVLPNSLIPASLDIEGIAGLRRRLRAGANVVTSLIPPGGGLAGVTQSTLDIAAGHRTVVGASRIVTELGLEPAQRSDFESYLAGRQPDRLTAESADPPG